MQNDGRRSHGEQKRNRNTIHLSYQQLAGLFGINPGQITEEVLNEKQMEISVELSSTPVDMEVEDDEIPPGEIPVRTCDPAEDDSFDSSRGNLFDGNEVFPEFLDGYVSPDEEIHAPEE